MDGWAGMAQAPKVPGLKRLILHVDAFNAGHGLIAGANMLGEEFSGPPETWPDKIRLGFPLDDSDVQGPSDPYEDVVMRKGIDGANAWYVDEGNELHLLVQPVLEVDV